MRKIFSLMLAIALLAALSLPIFANSAPKDWNGSDFIGAVAFDKECPIEVEREVLTFDISEFPNDYYDNHEEYLKYSAKVTAEYKFYNPTDTEVTATLVFPFGSKPDYGYFYLDNNSDYNLSEDTDKYGITVDGQSVKRNIRYTLSDYNFDLDKGLSRLRNGYVSHNFYSPDTVVTKYTYKIDGVNEKVYPNATVAFDWNGKNGESKLLYPANCEYSYLDDEKVRFSTWAENDKTVIFYVIGQPLTQEPEWAFYSNGHTSDFYKIKNGNIELLETETLTFEELALKDWKENIGISRIDWYNAIVDSFDEGSDDEHNFIHEHFGEYSEEFDLNTVDYMTSCMRWYEYEITIPPKASIVNTVTAPIYPWIDLSYTPGVYSYRYLISPASKWASFNEIEININTPFYLTESNIEGFEKDENRYIYSQRGLPSGELEFSLCESEYPERERNLFFPLLMLIFGAVSLSGIVIIFLVAAFIIGIVCAVILIVNRNKKKKC